MEDGRSACILPDHFVLFLSIHLLSKEFVSSWNTWAQVHGQAKREGSCRKLVWFLLYLTWQSICSEVLDCQSLCWQDHSCSQPVVLPSVLRLKKFSGGRFRNLLWITAQLGNIFLNQWGFFSLLCFGTCWKSRTLECWKGRRSLKFPSPSLITWIYSG